MDYKSQLIKAENYERKKLAEKFELAQKIGTATGFYKYYFDTLPNFPTYKAAFDNVNDLYFNIFGEYKYASYKSFNNRIKRYIKK